MKHQYVRMIHLYSLALFCIVFLDAIGIGRPVQAGASLPDEVFSISKNEKDLTIYYGPEAAEKRVVSLSSFINTKDGFKAVSFKRADIAGDNKTVVLEVMYENCCTSYPVSRALFIVQKNKPDQTYFSGMMIYDWKSYGVKSNDLKIAITIGPTHGNCSEYQLYHIASDKVIEEAECTLYGKDIKGQETKSPASVPVWMK